MDQVIGFLLRRLWPAPAASTQAAAPPRALVSYNFLWLSLALLVILAISFLLPLTPQDYWWNLPIGKAILQSGSVPRTETLSFTQAGQPVFYPSWLAAVVFWVIYRAGGLPLTFLLRGAALALTYGLMWWLMLRMGSGPKLATLLTVLAALASGNNWSIRAQLLAYPLFSVTLAVIYSWLRGERRLLWTLPVIGILWVNLHGSYVLFFVLLGTAFLFGHGDHRALLPWLLASALTVLANPRGIGIFGSTLELLRSPSNQIFSVEWHAPTNAGWQMNIFFGWLLLLVPLAAVSPRKLRLVEWVWLLIFGWLALSGTRYVIWFMLLMALYSAAWLSEWDARTLDHARQGSLAGLNRAIGMVMLLASLLFVPGLREHWWTAAPAPYDSGTTPVAATAWLAAHTELPGPMLADYAFSSYLTFALPARPVWIDTRFYPFPVEQWQQFQAVAAADASWPRILEEEHINLLMLATVTEPRLIQALESDTNWCEKYADPHAVIFARCEPLP